MSTFDQEDRRFYMLDDRGEVVDITDAFSDLKPLTAMIPDPDPDTNHTPGDAHWNATVTYDIGAEHVLYRMMNRFNRVHRAQMKKLGHKMDIANHRMKVFAREFQKNPEQSAMFAEYRRKTKNRHKK